MSKAARTRQNRTDNSQRLNEIFLGAMVTATAYNDEVRMVDVKAPVPSSAAFAGNIDDDLLPSE